MAGTLLGARKAAATKLGIALADYEAHLDNGRRWCSTCRTWRPLAAFARDHTRTDGISRRCRTCRARQLTTGDPTKIAARAAVRRAILADRLPHPDTLPCTDCDHRVGQPGDDGRRHHYDHHHGYDAGHRLDVVARCTPCHGLAERRRRKPELLAGVVTAYLEAKT